MTLTPHPLLVPRSKKQSKAIPVLLLRVFVVCKKGETHLIVQVAYVLVLLMDSFELRNRFSTISAIKIINENFALHGGESSLSIMLVVKERQNVPFPPRINEDGDCN
jgi:hypothetical protein